jgi:hypothetical protein
VRAQGLGLAAISYDAPDVLRRFADRFKIEYPLLSDTGSAVIRRFGLLNTEVEKSSRAFGVPHPGTFIVDRAGLVKRRFFEPGFQERDAAAMMLLAIGGGPSGPSVQLSTPHLDATISASDPRIAPGHRFAVVFDITPRPGMHVYARGDHDYQPVAPLFDPRPGLVLHEMAWPPSREYYFAPLDERVPVYDQPFRLVQPITLQVAAGNTLLETTDTLTVSGALSYQACDDRICYMPQRVPFTLPVNVQPLVRERLR